MTIHTDQELLDRAVDAVLDANNNVSEARIEASMSRVRNQLGFAAPAVATTAAQVVLGCAEIQALLPARERGELTATRATLVSDHVRECFACRRAERDLRAAAAAPAPARVRSTWLRFASAAALIGAIGTVGFLARDIFVATQSVEVLAGRLVDTDAGAVLGAGSRVSSGTNLRTPKGEGALVRLEDGSLVEMAERSELVVEPKRNGTQLHVGRGRVVVEAAKQQDGDRLWVVTNDTLVTVVGTVFTVNAGMVGSRVGVLEGAVRVGVSGQEDTLLGPGGQVASTARLHAVPLAQEVAWSREAERWINLLRELGSLEPEIAALGREELRYAPALDGAIPAGIMVYAGLPNATGRIEETWRLVRDRVESNPVLAEWWATAQTEGWPTEVDRALGVLAEIGARLGEEINVVGADDSFAVVAEVTDGNGVRAAITAALAEMAAGEDTPELVEGAIPAGDPTTALIWLDGNILGVGQRSMLEAIAATRAGAPGWQGSALRNEAMAHYANGVEVLVVAQPEIGEDGVTQILALDDKVVGDRHETRLSMDLPAEATGWVAAPAALGALELVSADARAAAVLAVDDPGAAAQRLIDLIANHNGNIFHLDEVRQRTGVDLLDDVAATLGGEFAVALDGPIVPVPAWKLVVEVDDPARLDAALVALVGEVDRALVAEGAGHAAVSEGETSGLSWHQVTITKADGASTSVYWGQIAGYLVAVPNPEALVRSAQVAETGYTLASSSRLREALPSGGENGVSGLFWLDLSGASEVFDLLASAIPAEARAEASALLADGKPVVGVLLVEGNRLELAGSREHTPLGWVRLALLAGLLDGDRG